MSARVLSDEDLDALFDLIIERTSAARSAESAFTTWCRCEHASTDDCEHKRAHVAAGEANDASWMSVIHFLHGLPLVSDLADVPS